ncbi:hypothetical protein DSO57_1001509 [Entomophthora muscae]|uniref:Uncharacterized protein n=2 Tax=Entomophthora muscae TaxID=34485 RepID=A0ACC2RWT7_9FUNG|nr:hypothetical protein DSO57_1013805 [Entomophthora muscae]KAJ9090540.1 hypothetical protein DSO57_1001509 [Entomophthora muscae]
MDAMDLDAYDAQHHLSSILEEAKTAALDLKPDNPLQFVVDFLLLLQSKAEESPLTEENIKEVVQDIKSELKDEIPSFEAESPFNQRLNSFETNSAPLRKRIRKDYDLNSQDPGTLPADSNGFPLNGGLTFGVSSAASHPPFSRARRGSVSAESIQPSDTRLPSVVIPKSIEAKMRIASATSSNLLFRNLEAEQRRCIVDAMFERPVKAGEVVIKQGDEGDNFYVVDQGAFDIFIHDRKVIEVHPGGSFGELALMYNTPRAATVKAVTDGTLWAVDRVTFRSIITDNTYRKRRLYESFLKTIPLLESLQPSEIAKISDALEPVHHEPDDVIIEQGTSGAHFYMIESGEVRVIQTIQSGEQIEHSGLKAGDYFGELALLNDSPRMASIIANTDVKLVALSKDAFVRLLGPVVDIMKRNVSRYSTAEGLALPANSMME